MIDGTTKVAGLIGGPAAVAQSLSPAIQNAAFQEAGLNWVYVSFPVEPGIVCEALEGLQAAGVKGLNVTAPHKLEIIGCLDALDDDAARIGAINTVSISPNGTVGHNTDAQGFARFLSEDAGFSADGCRALVLGAGGAARAVVAALSEAHAATIVVAAREPSKAEALRGLAARSQFDPCSISEIDRFLPGCGLIVNAIPLSEGQGSPVPEDSIPPAGLVVDLTYLPPVTPLIAAARRRGALAHSGLGMLLHQACLAFEIWTGTTPSIETMSAAAVSAAASHRDFPLKHPLGPAE